MNGHTALIRSLGTTGVLLLLSLVLLAIVSAIVAFDRWPQSAGAGTVERVAVDRPQAQRVETELVRSRRSAPVVRGVVVVRDGAASGAVGAADAILVADGEGDQSDGGGFGPPPPPVPFAAPGEGGRTRANPSTAQSGPRPPDDPPPLIQRATCEARAALGEAGGALDPACRAGSRGLSVETSAVAGEALGLTGEAVVVVAGER